MELIFPTDLLKYEPAFKWMLHTFDGFAGGEQGEFHKDFTLYLNHLLIQYTGYTDTSKLITDLTEMDCWRYRVMSIDTKMMPYFWAPLGRSYASYAKRVAARGYLKTVIFQRPDSNPPSDMIRNMLNHAVENGFDPNDPKHE